VCPPLSVLNLLKMKNYKRQEGKLEALENGGSFSSFYNNWDQIYQTYLYL